MPEVLCGPPSHRPSCSRRHGRVGFELPRNRNGAVGMLKLSARRGREGASSEPFFEAEPGQHSWTRRLQLPQSRGAPFGEEDRTLS